jgi:protein-disulfide isomerase
MENIEKKEEIIIEKTNRNNNQAQIAGAIIIAGLFIAGAIMLKGSTPPVKIEEKANIEVKNIDLEKITERDHIKGSPNAQVVIVEYSDLECPFCKVFHKTMNTVINENKEISWVYRHFPIESLHKKALNEAVATECAWEAGGNEAFWKYIDKVFEITTSNDRLEETELPKIAELIDLDVKTFNDCLLTSSHKDKINQDLESGKKAGVRGTPKSFILKNGKVIDTIDGAQSINIVRGKVKEALEN